MRVTKWAAVAGCAALVLSSAACSGRSVEAYCAELDAGNKKIQANMDAAGQDAMAGLGSIFVNFGEYTRMLHKMQEKAPEEIKSDLDDSVKVWDAQADRAGDAAANPLGALASTFMASMMASASMQNVDRYTKEHCGKTVFGMGVTAAATTGTAEAGAADSAGATPTPTPTPLPENAEPAGGLPAGSELDVREAGGVVAVGAPVRVGSHTVVVSGGDDTVVSMFTAAGRSPGLAYAVQDAQCQWGLGTRADGSAVFVVQEFEDRPASGLTEASTGEFIAAYDPVAGSKLWRTEWKGDEPFGEGVGCATPDGGYDSEAMTFTTNGYLAFTSSVFDLRDGSEHKVTDLRGALGAWLLRPNPDTYDYAVLDPATRKVLGRVGEPMEWRPGTGAVGVELVPTWQQGGGTVMAVRSNDEDGFIEVVELPSGRRVWKGKDEATGYQVVGLAGNGSMVTTAGVFTPSGKRAFAMTENFDPCAVEGDEVYGVGGTLVALDASTGAEGRVDTGVTSCRTLPPVTSAGAVVAGEDMVLFDKTSTRWDLLTADS